MFHFRKSPTFIVVVLLAVARLTALNVLDPEFARLAAEAFEKDLARSHQVTLQECESRPWAEKLKEKLANIVETQL